tara:strand:- start:1453 stop:1647 length:195 start_codon:yes stop_codon:yes gene_type:complete
MEMKETSTAIIKLTRQEIDTIINTLNFILTTNLPIDEDFLKPYHRLKTDLKVIRKRLIEGEQEL